MSSLLCVPIAVDTPPEALAEAAAAKAAGADLVEFRLDGIFSGSAEPAEFRRVVRMVSDSPIPCIATCRPVADGGQYDGDDMARISLFEALGTAAGGAGSLPPRFLDIELATYQRSANIKQKINLAVGHPGQVRDLSTSLILSFHDFNGRPADLSRRLLAMADEPAAAVVKIAFRARSVRDNLELFDLLAENAAGKPLIALAMGEAGLMSRVLAPKFGGFLTFASLRPESTTAPGQPTVEELLNLYRFRSIGPRTRVYGVVGWPVSHSLSPVIHNAAFEHAAHNGVYLPFPVPPEYEHFKATLHALIDHPRLDFAGCSVTIPHKEHLVRFAREQMEAGEHAWSLDELSALCGAANTLAVQRSSDGRPTACRVMNTDGPAAAALLTDAIGPLAGRRIAIIGAGGAARSIAASLLQAGSQVLLVNRTHARADSLAADLSGPPVRAGGTIAAVQLNELPRRAPDAVVHATPVGMPGGPSAEASPLDDAALRNLRPSTVVFDTVYAPRGTPLLNQARAAERRVIDGLTLLVAQAAMQSEAWTGTTPPLPLLEHAARERLAMRPE